MCKPAVSAIIAVKNAERYLAQALDSVAAQTRPADEVLVIDGQSTDGTAAIAAAYPFVRFVPQRGTGFADAWNQGIEMARGELVTFLDSDDRWPPYKLERQAGYLAAHPEIDYTVGRVTFFHEPGAALPSSFRPELLNGDHVGYIPGNIVARRALFDRLGGFGTEWDISSDVEWFFRAKDGGVRHAVLPEVLLLKRVHQTNLSMASPEAPRFRREILHICRASIHRQRTAR